MKKRIALSLPAFLIFVQAYTQELLPPVPSWSGKSSDLIAKPDNKWITVAEKSGFKLTPGYDETMSWFKKLCDASKSMEMVSIGASANNQGINMVIASSENSFSREKLNASPKKLILIQAGIHAGEIDGKDAGMMLMRDIAFGSKSDLLKSVNILFVPILNVDGHERTSPFNRVNQRGPENMGWRTNANNYNLNRDYTKLDTEEVKAIVKVINEYDPDLYLDLHVTDGADYQYDITFGFLDAFSPSISQWLTNALTPFVNRQLKEMGHIPGPLVFAANEKDFTNGMIQYPYSPRYSNGYGDVRHLPTILLENHSLKPFKQRVLGTYVFLESILQLMNSKGDELKAAIEKDRKIRNTDFVLTWKENPVRDSILFAGIESFRKKSEVTGSDFVVWTGKPVQQKIAITKNNLPDVKTAKPKIFYVPAHCTEVISRLKHHGIRMETITSKTSREVGTFRITNYQFSKDPVEGHNTVSGSYVTGKSTEIFYPGSVQVNLDQPLGDLVMYLLHPGSPDSFYQWGFFPGMFVRTEYMEQYVAEPLAAKMLNGSPQLKAEFESMKAKDPDFAKDPDKVYSWFYARSPYFDKHWLLYPIFFE